MKKAFVVLSALSVACSACAAWYDNPTVKASAVVDAATGQSDPHFINKSSDDGLLMVNLNSEGHYCATVLFSIRDLKSAMGEVSGLGTAVVGTSEAAYGDNWKGGAISSDLKLMIPGSGLGSATSLIQTDKTDWSKGDGLYPLTFGDSHKPDGLDFGTGSTCLYSNADGGSVLYRWMLPAVPYQSDANVLTVSASKQTSASRIRNLSVHRVNGRELVYYGEGSGTTGRVWAMDVTDADANNWIEYEVVASGELGEFKDITNVKLSNENSAVPVLYALSDSGKLAVCQLTDDGTDVLRVVRIFQKDDINGFANVNDKFRNFEVSKDGSFAFFAHKTVAGVTTIRVVSDSGESGPASYCDSAAVALLASSDSKVSVTIPTFLSRYISILDSACLNRFNSSDPVGLSIIVR